MKRLVFILSWLTILVVGLAIGGALFYNNQRVKLVEDQRNQIKEMGLACIHHVQNLSASANANLKDFYSVGISNPEQYQIEETLNCLQQYPLYDGQPHFSGFNTTLN